MPIANFKSADVISQPRLWDLLMDVAKHGATPKGGVNRQALSAEDIESRPVWKPMHLQPVYRDAPMIGGAVSAALFERGLCLPSGSALTDADQRRVVDTLLATRG